jgi:bifunctional UDP-N-acetylglucosamine pyrophosphorylase/glucosamine-1-phosphate N-acetyltransferase
VRVALQDLAGRGVELGSEVVVLTGDTPLLTTKTLEELLAAHREQSAAASVLTAVLPDATGYGRIIRDSSDAVESIVEHKDANQAQREIREINSGMYVFAPDALIKALAELTTNNAQGEEYLTDVLAIERGWGLRVAAHAAEISEEIAGVNDREQLADAAAALRNRINRAWMREGVTIIDPTTTWIDATATLAKDVTLHPGSAILGLSTIASGAVIGPRTTLTNCVVKEGYFGSSFYIHIWDFTIEQPSTTEVKK